MAAVAVVLASAPDADAGTGTRGMAVAVAVNMHCQIRVNNGVVFGTYTGAQLDGEGSLNVKCNRTLSVLLQLSNGLSPMVNRRMQSGAARLNYELYTDAARTKIWTDSPGYLLDEPSKKDKDVEVYARLFANQSAPMGNYSDTIVATLLW